MKNEVSVQLLTFIQSIVLGGGIALLYDLLRPLRLRHPRLTGILDGGYCLTALLTVFVFLLRRVEGIPRLYVLLGLAGGGTLFFCLLSAPLRPIWDFWADTAARTLRLLEVPVRGLWALCKKIGFHCKNLFYFAKKCYTIRKNWADVCPPGRQGRREPWERRQKRKNGPESKPAFSQRF